MKEVEIISDVDLVGRRDKGEPLICIEFENKQKEEIESGNMTVTDIVNMVKSRAEEMEIGETLKAAGLKGHRFESSWLKDTKSHDIAGFAQHIPRE